MQWDSIWTSNYCKVPGLQAWLTNCFRAKIHGGLAPLTVQEVKQLHRFAEDETVSVPDREGPHPFLGYALRQGEGVRYQDYS